MIGIGCMSRDFDWLFDWDFGLGPRGRGREGRKGHGGPRRGFFRQGEVRLALLSLLDDGPAHGYELMKRLEERSGGTYQASAGTVYPVLQQLEDEGLVRAQEEEGKKVFHLTDAGREELTLNQEAVERIWKRAGGWKEWGGHMGPESAEIWSSWGRLTKAAFKAAARADLEGTEKIREILERTRKELEALK
jgi:DNA-binding PadR family transcriptional regulator